MRESGTSLLPASLLNAKSPGSPVGRHGNSSARPGVGTLDTRRRRRRRPNPKGRRGTPGHRQLVQIPRDSEFPIAIYAGSRRGFARGNTTLILQIQTNLVHVKNRESSVRHNFQSFRQIRGNKSLRPCSASTIGMVWLIVERENQLKEQNKCDESWGELTILRILFFSYSDGACSCSIYLDSFLSLSLDLYFNMFECKVCQV